MNPTTYEVNLIVRGLDLDDEVQMAHLEQLDYLALPAEIDGKTEIEVEIPATSAIEAWSRIYGDLRGAGMHVVRVDSDLVGISDIASRLHVSRETVRLWSVGKRREGFPPTFGRVSQSPVWRWSDVAEWVDREEDLKGNLDAMPFPGDVIEALNGALSHRRESARSEGWIAPSNVISIERQRNKRHAPRRRSDWTLAAEVHG